MASWKKILVEGDAVADNLATANLVQSSTPRTYDVGSSQVLSFEDGTVNFKNSSGVAKVQIGANSTNVLALLAGGALQFSDSNNSNNCTIDVPTDITSSYTITLPSAGPGGTKILQSNSSGNLSWIDTPSGSGGLTELLDDTSPQLGGHLDTNGFRVELDNNIPITGDNTSGVNINIAKVNTSNYIEFGQATVNAYHLGDTFMDRYVFDDDGTTSDGNVGNGGQVTLLGTNTVTTAGRAYYYNSSGGWSFAAVSSAEAAASLLAVATGNASNRGMLLRGIVQVSNGGTNLSVGKAVYITTNGSFTTTVPTTSGHYARIVGYALDTTTIFFTPSNDYIEIA